MLYHLHEFQKLASLPTHQWAQAMGLFLNTVGAQDLPFGRMLSATNCMIERATRQFPKPDFGIHTFTSQHYQQHGIVEERVISNLPFCNLVAFDRRIEGEKHNFGRQQPNVLIVAPLSGHYATLLRDTVRTFVSDHNVWITDWKNAMEVPLHYGAFTLDDYVDVLLSFLKIFHGHVHIIGVCQPVIPVLMAVAHLASLRSPNQPLSMTLMGGPVDARINPGVVNRFANDHSLEWFRRTIIDTVPMAYPGRGRKVCPGFMMLDGFISLHIDRHQEVSLKLFEHLIQGDMETVDSHEKFYDEYRAVMDIPADYYLDSIEYVFHKAALAQGHMRYKHKKIDLSRIVQTALLTVEGEKDDISCPGQTYAAHHLCESLDPTRKNHYLQTGVGHYGIFNGRRFREQIFPVMAEFIQRFNQ